MLPPGLQDINQVFCAADWLAIHYQKRVTVHAAATHVGALLTGLALHLVHRPAVDAAHDRRASCA